MSKPLFSKSVRKYIRFQKARIRREFSDSQKRQELIAELRKRFETMPRKEEKKPVKKVVQKKEELAATAKEK